MIKVEKIIAKFENLIYKAEVPIHDKFTGSVVLSFHWFQGKLMKTEIAKSSKLENQDSFPQAKPIDK